jgi:hypothetical protein
VGIEPVADDQEILAVFEQAWRRLVTVPPFRAYTDWNTVLCGITIDNGDFAIMLTTDFSIDRQIAAVRLCLTAVRDRLQADFATDADYEAACVYETERHLHLLIGGCRLACRALSGDDACPKTISLRVIAELDEDALYEGMLPME